MELAIATHTAPGDWWHESDETIATAILLLETAAAAHTERGRRRGR